MDFTTILFGISIIISLIALIYKSDKKKIDELENDQKEIKENYLTRFEKLHSTLNEFKLDTSTKLNELKILIIESKKKN